MYEIIKPARKESLLSRSQKTYAKIQDRKCCILKEINKFRKKKKKNRKKETQPFDRDAEC